MQYVRKALTELAYKGILEPKLLSIDGQENLIPFEEAKILGKRGQTEDVIYTLYPAGKFSSESKQANANLNRLLEK